MSALACVLLTGSISFKPQRMNSFLMCSRKSSSSGDVTRALMSCMHATWNTAWSKEGLCGVDKETVEKKRERTNERSNTEVDASLHSKCVSSLESQDHY